MTSDFFPEKKVKAKQVVKNAEQDMIQRALEKFDGHRGKTAEYLEMDKSTLWRKMKKYDLL